MEELLLLILHSSVLIESYLIARGDAEFHHDKLLEMSDCEGGRTEQVAPTDGLLTNHDADITPRNRIVLAVYRSENKLNS